MKLSKYYNKIKLKDNLYAIFNRLYLKILYVDKKELLEIENFKISLNQKKILEDYLIYSNNIMDKELFNIITNNLENEKSIHCIYIVPSEFCNMNCSYCFVYKKSLNFKHKKLMTTEVADIIIDKISKYINNIDNKEKLLIQFYGGEPTLNWKIIEYIIDNIKNKPNSNIIEWSLITNGTNLNDKMMNYIYKNNIITGISLDGPININNLSRTYIKNSIAEKNYNKIINNLNKMIKMNINLAISFTITDMVLKNKLKIFKWLENIGVKFINYNMLHFKDYKSEYLSKYYEEVTNFMIESYKILGDKIYEDRLNRKIKTFNTRLFKYSDCSAGLGKQITINSDGDITYCNCDFLDKSKYIENIKNIEIMDILNYESRKKLWIDKLPIYNKKCIKCPMISICGGGCIVQMNSNNIDEGFCIHTKKTFKWLLEKNYIESINL